MTVFAIGFIAFSQCNDLCFGEVYGGGGGGGGKQPMTWNEYYGVMLKKDSEKTWIVALTNKRLFNRFPNDKLDSSKQKEFANHSFKLDENGRKFSKWVKTVEKGEIARYEQFLLFPLCFQKAYTANT